MQRVVVSFYQDFCQGGEGHWAARRSVGMGSMYGMIRRGCCASG
jgi:hypothetical protein